jgi:hypothetical protein
MSTELVKWSNNVIMFRSTYKIGAKEGLRVSIIHKFHWCWCCKYRGNYIFSTVLRRPTPRPTPTPKTNTNGKALL